MTNTIEELYRKGQSVWCDNISRGMIDSGALQRLIDLGVVGVTSNPTILMKAITGGTDYDALFVELVAEGKELIGIYEGLVLPDIADAADILRPVYDRTDGADGYISIEVNPKLAFDTDATVAEARRLSASLDRPNVLIKVPATEEGFPAIETLIGDGISVNVTLIFSLEAHEKAMQAYLGGLRRFAARTVAQAEACGSGDFACGTGGSGGHPGRVEGPRGLKPAARYPLSKVASVASFFVSRVDTAVDKLLGERSAKGAKVDHLLGRAAVANARLAYARFEEVFDPSGAFGALAQRGARVQRPLWASTSTKNPAYPDTMYLDALVGPYTVNTLPPDALEATLDHGQTGVTIRDDLDQARAVLDELAKLDIDLSTITDKLRVDGVAAFARSFAELLENLAAKTNRAQTEPRP